MGTAWLNTFVEPANLTVHVSALRRALRDRRDGNRFIINIPGRGVSLSRRSHWDAAHEKSARKSAGCKAVVMAKQPSVVES
jgi:DNA-binding winged helix-turn-helix (wHTH) protein